MFRLRPLRVSRANEFLGLVRSARRHNSLDGIGGNELPAEPCKFLGAPFVLQLQRLQGRNTMTKNEKSARRVGAKHVSFQRHSQRKEVSKSFEIKAGKLTFCATFRRYKVRFRPAQVHQHEAKIFTQSKTHSRNRNRSK